MNLELKQVTSVLEGALLAAGEPLTVSRLQQLFPEEEQATDKEIRQLLAALADDYKERAINLVELASGFCFQVKKELSPWVGKLWHERPPKYSRAYLETLALIAYRQPVTRGEIEEIRGVTVSSNIIKTLQERDWIRVVGHKEVPGRPSLLATTKVFLDYFGLKSLQDLPSLTEIKDITEIAPQLELKLKEENSQEEQSDDELNDANEMIQAEVVMEGEQKLMTTISDEELEETDIPPDEEAVSEEMFDEAIA